MAIELIRPEHLQTIWVAKFKDWAVEPAGLPAQSPFCGRGYITTDGPRREHSRALLKPSFNKANMTDLSTSGEYVRMALDQIPRDGSTGDLQPLFFNLYLDTATLFLFGESFYSLAGGMSSDARDFLEAFDYAMLGSGFQIALGPSKLLYRDPKWYESCRTTHAFADRYVDKAQEYTRNLLSTKNDSSGHGDRHQRHIMLHAMAEQTDDKIELRNQLLQALMAAQFKPATSESLPFGGGPRGCAGRLKATTEASYFIVRMSQEFCQIESRDPLPWTGRVQLTAKNANGCKIALTPA